MLKKSLILTLFFVAVLGPVVGRAEIVSKTYLDKALATKVSKTGDESVVGIKTFADIPLTETSGLPTADATLSTTLVTETELNTALAPFVSNAKASSDIAAAIASKLDKVVPGTAGNIAVVAANGTLQDGGIRAVDVVQVTGNQTINGIKTFGQIPLSPTPSLPVVVP